MQAKANKLNRLFERAMQCHQAGDLPGARRGYLDILKAVPDQFEALHYLGLLEAQTGRYAEAITRIRHALKVNPQSAEANSNLGCVFLETGRHEEALMCFDRALALQSRNVEALFNRGNALRGLQRHDDALDAFDALLDIQPRYLPALINKATLLQELGRDEEATASLEGALQIKPDEPGIYLNLGLIERKLKHFEKALSCYDQALSLAPEFADAYYNRGNVFMDMRRYEDALASYERALALNSSHAEAFNTRGDALLALERYEDALANFEKAIDIRPNFPDAFSNRGNAFLALRRYEEALASYGRAVELEPNYAKAHYNKSLCELMLGDFEKGWDHYEWRFEERKALRRSFPQPLWDGRFVDGVLFAWAEQGLGDQILYASMLDDLRQRATRLLVEVEPRLVELFRRSFPGIDFVAQSEPPNAGHIEAQVPAGSIGRYFRRRWEDFPARDTGYLIADAGHVKSLRERLTADRRYVVGLSWISKAAHYGEQKSARLGDFEPILTVPGSRFVDLQYGDTLEERMAVKESTGVEISRLEDVDNLRDIDGLAALVTACDAVVTVSNTTAHIAGALGKKVFLLLPYSQGSLWYWHVDREDSAWYPSVRLFRQPSIGDWGSAVQRVAKELERLVASASRPPD